MNTGFAANAAASAVSAIEQLVLALRALLHDPARDGEKLDVFPAFEQVATITTLGDLPMTILTAAHRNSDGLTPGELTRLDTIWRDGPERWAQLSTGSNVVTVEDTGHAIQDDQPAIFIDELLAPLHQHAPGSRPLPPRSEVPCPMWRCTP